MFDDGNSPFSNYETTEHKMLGDSEADSGGGGTHGPRKQHIEVAGTPVSIGRLGTGLVVLLIGIVIGVVITNTQDSALECFVGAGIVIASIVGAVAIWRHEE